MAGPQIVVNDSGSNKSRLERIKKKSNLVEIRTIDKEDQKYLEDFESMNFFAKQQFLSQPSDVNFLDNEVPEEEAN